MGVKITAVLIGLMAAAFTLAADDLAPVKEEAVRDYDRGSYDDALKTLRSLDIARALDGPLLYRLYYCERVGGHDDDARKTLDRARQALEAESQKKSSLEVAFYLANTYSNLGRSEDAQKVARKMTAEIEAGSVASPTSAIGRFQLGKLYQDQGRQVDASSSYQKAVDGFDLKDGRYAGNARWALRYLGSQAFSKADFVASEAAFARLTSLSGGETTDWDSLAAARVRLGKYPQAAEAWKSSVKLDQANGDDARYAARLAETAARIAPLPATAPGETAFTAMGPTELAEFLKSRAEAATAAQERVSEGMQPGPDGLPTRALDPALRTELTQTLRQTRQEFVAAGLEYALKRFGIRETAFEQGYAVLIFQDRPWEVPADPVTAGKKSTPAGS